MTLRVLAEAELEAQEAAQWYERRQPGLGEDFLDELTSAWESIEAHPLQFAQVGGVVAEHDVRRFLLKRFPYKVIFEIRPEEILVLAVAHAKRRPMYWKDRLEVDD